MTISAPLHPPPRDLDSLGGLVGTDVAALSAAAPFAVQPDRPGQQVIRLLSGGPAAEALPVTDLAEAMAARLGDRTDAVEALQYSDSPGLPRLRALLAEREGVEVERIVITNGALHGVSLSLLALLDPGDLVVADDPIFPDTKRIIELGKGRLLPVRVGRHGIDVDAVEEILRAGRRIKAVYTVADFHNPSGGTLPAAARIRLLELAARYGFVVISDNPYRHHRYAGAEIPDFDPADDHLVTVNTFSKTLGPGLRLGWVLAPRWLVPHLVNLRRRNDFHSGTLIQQVVADLLERPAWFDELIRTGRQVYAGRAASIVASLRAEAPDLFEFDEPQGGFFIWGRLRDPQLQIADLLAAAGRHGVLFAPGQVFAAHAGSDTARYARLAFSGPDPDHLSLVGPRLAAAAADLQERG